MVLWLSTALVSLVYAQVQDNPATFKFKDADSNSKLGQFETKPLANYCRGLKKNHSGHEAEVKRSKRNPFDSNDQCQASPEGIKKIERIECEYKKYERSITFLQEWGKQHVWKT